MGLREKVALAIASTVLNQILFIHCMPRSQPNFATNTKNIKSKSPEVRDNDRLNKIKTLTKESSNFAAINDSVVIRFPEVEYPSSSQAGDYYRFQNDYPSEFPPNYMNLSPQASNHKRESKCKRKYVASTNIKPEVPTTNMEHDPLSQLHRLAESLLPEVDYPLSARDLWLPQHRNPVQDATRCGLIEPHVEFKGAANGNGTLSSNDTNDDNFKLCTIINALNTEKKSSREILNCETNSMLCHPNKSDGLHNEMNENTSAINSNFNIEPFIPINNASSQGDIISSTSIMRSRDINSVIQIPNNEPSVYIVIVKTNPENGDSTNPVLGIPEQDQSSEDRIISTNSTLTNSDVSVISLKSSLSDIVTSIIPPTIRDNSDVKSKVIIPEKSQHSHEDIIPDPPEKDLFDNNTVATHSDTSDNITQLIIPEECQSFCDNNVSTITTEASCYNITEPSKIITLSDCGNSFTMTTINRSISDIILDLTISNANKTSSNNVIADAVNVTCSDIIPEPYNTSSLGGCRDTETTMDRDNINHSQLPNNKNIVSTNTAAANSAILTEPSSVTSGQNLVLSTPSGSTCSDDDIPLTPNNYFDSLDGGGEDFSRNVTVNDMGNSTVSNEDYNPQELITQDFFSLLNTYTDTENENVDPNDPLLSNCLDLDEGTEKQCQNMGWHTTTENEQFKDHFSNASIVTDTLPKVAGYPDDCWLILYDTENSTQDVPDYEAVYLITESIYDGSISVIEDVVDSIMCAQDANSTSLYECIDPYSSYNETSCNLD